VSETKNEAFHRLAGKRMETITNAIRIFGNLSGPSYDWSPAEVLAYIAQIDQAKNEALDGFKDTKRWRLAAPQEVAEARAADPVSTDADDAEAAPEPPEDGSGPNQSWKHLPQPRPRQFTFTEIIREAGDTVESLAEMIAMQREVIEWLQGELNNAGASHEGAGQDHGCDPEDRFRCRARVGRVLVVRQRRSGAFPATSLI
jgi:hypothetical protein